MKINRGLHILILFSFSVLFVESCDTLSHNIPFPEKESEFLQPVSKPVKFSESFKINWTTSYFDSAKPITQKKIDLNNLPSRPIDMVDFQPFNIPMTENLFPSTNILTNDFSLTMLSSKKVFFKISVLGQPKRIKAGIPFLRDGATQGILVFGQDQGLPGTVGQCMLQDVNGIIWIGTDNGLCRFDGENCDNYSTLQGLSNNYIWSLLQDNTGQIWIGTGGGGIDVIDKEARTLKHFSMEEGLSDNNIRTLLKDSQGRIWIGTDKNGINIIDEREETLKQINTTTGLCNNTIYSLLEDSQGQIWVGTGGSGIDVIDVEHGTIKNIDTAEGLGDNRVFSLLEDHQGQVWIGTQLGGIDVINEKAAMIKHISTKQGLSHDNIRSMLKDTYGKIWVGTHGGGVDVIDSKTDMIKHLNIAQGLSNNYIHSLLANNQGQIWIGTFSGGINLIDNEVGGGIKHLSTSQGLSNNLVFSLLENEKKQIWIGTLGGGIDVIDPQFRTIKYVTAAQGLSSDLVRCLVEDTHGQIWIGTRKGGVNVINQETGTIKYLNTEQGLSNNSVLSLLADSRDQIWVGTDDQRVDVIDEKAGIIKHLSTAGGLIAGKIFSFLEDSYGQIWISIIGRGVAVIDQKAETIKYLTAQEGLSNNTVYCLLEDDKDQIWIGTLGGGLNVINQKAGSIMNFSINEGLSDMGVLSLKEKNGSIYAGTGKGLTVISSHVVKDGKQEWSLKTYGKSQGFLNVDFNDNSALLTKEGQLWWGIGHLLTIMDEHAKDTAMPHAFISGIDIMERSQYFLNNDWLQTKLKEIDTIWNVQMDTFYVYNQLQIDTSYLKKNKITWDSIKGPWNMPDNLTIPFDANHLTFHFTGTRFRNLDKTRYRYILEGNDKTWSTITDKSFADYRNLSPGNYTFKICSRGFNGLWSKPAILNFKITPPWWKTGWFRTVEILLLVSFIVYITRFFAQLRLRQRLAILEKQQAVEHERQRISRDMHDELGSGISMISMMSDLVKQQPLNAKAKSEVEKISIASNELVHQLREIVWTLNPQNDNLKNLLVYLRQYAIGIFENTAIECKVKLPDQIPDYSVSGEMRRSLFLVVKESLNNLFKHAQAQHAAILMSVNDHELEISISDDGMGIDELKMNHIGNGLKNMKKRMEDIKGSFQVFSDKGTTIKLSIHLNKDINHSTA